MNPLLKKLLSRYMAPAGDDGADTGGSGSGEDEDDSADRGDDFVPTEDDSDDAAGKAKGADKESDADDEEADEDDEDKEKKDGEDKGGKTKGKDGRIPLARHKIIIEKERERRAGLERELAQYRQGKQVAAVNEDISKVEDKILALEKEYTKLMSDGEVDKATDAMAKIRRMEREVNEQKSELRIAAAEARATENARYSVVLERVEAAYPALNEDHDDFDEEVAQDVLDLKAAYQSRRGMTPSAALQAAVEKLLGKKTARQKDAVDVTPRVPKDDDKKADDATADRKKRAVEKALDAKGRTPPNTFKVGVDSDKIGGALTAQTAMKLSEDEFNKLDEKALARMRGDEL